MGSHMPGQLSPQEVNNGDKGAGWGGNLHKGGFRGSSLPRITHKLCRQVGLAPCPVRSLGTMINLQNVCDVQASAPISWAQALCTQLSPPVPHIKPPGDRGELRSPQRGCATGTLQGASSNHQ